MAFTLAIFQGENGLGYYRDDSDPETNGLLPLEVRPFIRQVSQPISDIEQLKTEIMIVGSVDEDPQICFLKPAETIEKIKFSYHQFDKTREHNAIYVIPNGSKTAVETTIKEILEQETSGLSKRKPRSFAIVISDGEIEKAAFLKAWNETVVRLQDIVERIAAFGQEVKKNVSKRKKEIKKLKEKLSRKKRNHFIALLVLKLMSPEFLGFLASLCLIIACLAGYFDPTFLLPLTSAAAGPVLMAILGCALFMVACAGAVYGLCMWVFDYKKSQYRVSSMRPDYGLLAYLKDVPARIRNWHHDHKLQAAFLYIGLLGSIALALFVVIAGIDNPFLHFIGEVVASGFKGLGVSSAAPDGGVFALQVFVAVITTLLPLALGGFGSQMVDLVEEGVLPSKEREIAEVSLLEDSLHADVRFYGGLQGTIDLGEAPETTPHYNSIGASYISVVSQNPLKLVDNESTEHTFDVANIYVALQSKLSSASNVSIV